MKASAVLFRQQNNLRKILSQYIPLEITSAGPIADSTGPTEDDSSADSPGPQLLMQQLMAAATLPSPLKAIFTMSELEAAALMVTQYLTSLTNHQEPEVPDEEAAGSSAMPRSTDYSAAYTPPPLQQPVARFHKVRTSHAIYLTYRHQLLY